MELKNYIGDQAIKKTENTKDGKIKVTLDNGKEAILTKDLYNLVVKDEKGDGSIYDCTKAYIAREFLVNMGKYGISVGEIEAIAQSIGTLVHNLRERKIGQKFGVETTYEIPVSEIIE